MLIRGGSQDLLLTTFVIFIDPLMVTINNNNMEHGVKNDILLYNDEA